MRAVVLHAPGDVQVEEVDRPSLEEPTDAIIRVTAACICGSDLWPYRGLEPVETATRMGTSTSVSSMRSALRSETSRSVTTLLDRSSPQTTRVRSAFPDSSLVAYTRS